mgnify:FL=1
MASRFGTRPICPLWVLKRVASSASTGHRTAETVCTVTESCLFSRSILVLRELRASNYEVCAKRKMWRATVRGGWDVDLEQTARVICKAGLHGARRGRKLVAVCLSEPAEKHPDLVDRNFTTPGPNRIWVADIPPLPC